MAVAPYPWDRLAAASWAESSVAAWVAAAGLRWRGAVVDRTAIEARLREPSAARLVIRLDGADVIAVAPWPLWRAIRAAVLGDDRELAGPRPPTPVERAFVAVAVAAAIPAATVEPLDEPLRLVPGAVLVEVAITAPVAGTLALVLGRVPPAPRALASLVRARGDRLPVVSATLELARGVLRGGAGALADLRPRDVVVVGAPAGVLRVGLGAFPVALDPGGAGLIVQSPYRRPIAMPPAPDGPDDRELADDLTVPLTLVVADVAVSARQLLELTAGQVLATGRPVGTQVELRAGARTVARGELVTIDGALGVRVTEVAGGATAELVGPAPAVIAPASR